MAPERLVVELDDRLQYRFRVMGRHERPASRWVVLVDLGFGLALALLLRRATS